MSPNPSLVSSSWNNFRKGAGPFFATVSLSVILLTDFVTIYLHG